MEILLTNDDGIFAPGLAAIYTQLIKIGNVTVAAPCEGQSGASHRVTLGKPLICNKVDVNDVFTGYSIAGSPADCVKLAVMQLCKKPPDILVSGINNGANAGINIYYSGTVAAAMEGVFLGIGAVAMSLAWDDEMDFERASKYCINVLEQLMPVGNEGVLNINIPALTGKNPRGIRVVPQSMDGYQQHYRLCQDDKHLDAYEWISGENHTSKEPVDTICIDEGYITVTSLTAGMTDYKKNSEIEKKDLKL